MGIDRERRKGTMIHILIAVRPHAWGPMGLMVLSLLALYTLALDQG
jgi:hypothetical protein